MYPGSGSVSNANAWLDVQSVIRELTQDFATAFNTGNYDQAAAMFALDGCLMSPQRETAQGNKAIESMLRGYGEAGYHKLRMETIRVEHSGDMAVEIGRYTIALLGQVSASLASLWGLAGDRELLEQRPAARRMNLFASPDPPFDLS